MPRQLGGAGHGLQGFAVSARNVGSLFFPQRDPRTIVAKSLTYLTNNRSRMNYPGYRQQGLPVTSSLMESFVKEMNWRVKGTE